MKPPPTRHGVLPLFTTFLQHLPLTEETWAIGVSGGADSLALCFLLKETQDIHKKNLIALTVDHSLRPESAQEAHQVHEWLNNLGLEHHILQWTPPSQKPITQEDARDGRYQELFAWCHNHNVSAIFTAHHALDQAETILMRFCKGSHLKGLKGIPSIKKEREFVLIRPLLKIWPDQLREYLKSKKQPWIEDPSNQNPKYLRTIARQLLTQDKSPLQKLGLKASGLINWLEKFSDSYTLIQREIDNFFTIHFKTESDLCFLQWKGFSHVSIELKPHILETLFTEKLKSGYAPRWSSLKRLAQDLHNKKTSTLGGYKFSTRKNVICIEKELDPRKRSGKLSES